MPVSTCAVCGRDVELWQARPQVVGGRVVLRCPQGCEPEGARTNGALEPFDEDERTLAAPLRAVDGSRAPAQPGADTAPGAERRRGFRYRVRLPILLPGASLATALLMLGAFSTTGERPAMQTAAPVSRKVVAVTLEPPQIEPPPQRWVHPIPDASFKVPFAATRKFGAERPGDRPPECGRGHCGVDLEYPRGTPVVSVLGGVVLRVVRDDDRRGGRYVEVAHDDGTVASYMHLDRCRDDLRPGTRVVAGELLGTLGASGIEHSVPHLHFAVKVGDRYVDPAPRLMAARPLELFEIVADSTPQAPSLSSPE